MTNEVGLGSSMHNFFTDFWIKVQMNKTIQPLLKLATETKGILSNTKFSEKDSWEMFYEIYLH